MAFDRLARTLLRCLAPETAHDLTLTALRAGLVAAPTAPDPPILETRVWDLGFANPIGLAPGFDKNGRAVGPLSTMGFGFVEIGGVTPQAQSGNPRPRVFRLPEDRAVINRLGFNNDGLDAIAHRLERVGEHPCPLGANLGMNKAAADPAADFITGLTRLAPLVDYVTVNVSSPNTPGLRDLQERGKLDDLLDHIVAARDDVAQHGTRLPVLVKIAPELDDAALGTLIETALARGIDGLVVSNTTTARPQTLRGRHRNEAGGLSGCPLFEPSTRMLARARALAGPALPLIGVGGIASGADAYAKIRAGAALVQLYTALIYQGPRLIAQIKADLAARIEADGFATLGEAVGRDVDNPA